MIKLKDYKALVLPFERYTCDCSYGKKGVIKGSVMKIFLVEREDILHTFNHISNETEEYDDCVVVAQEVIAPRRRGFGGGFIQVYIKRESK